MGLFLRATDTVYALRFLRLLTTSWEDTNAFKKGIIDENGKRIRKPKTSDEKSVYTYFHRLVFSLKRMLNMIPFGQSKLASYAAALWLIKEESGMSEELISELLNKIEIDLDTSNIHESIEENLVVGLYENKGLVYDKENGELIEKKIDFIVEKSSPIGNFKGIPIYEGINKETNQRITFTKDNVSMKEEISNVTGDSTTMAMPPTAKSPEDENPHLFRRYKIFDIPREAFNKFQTGKIRFERWSKYLNLEDSNQKKIYDYATKKPKSMVVLRDSTTGALLAIRKRSKNSD
jgi:hypothetical protein